MRRLALATLLMATTVVSTVQAAPPRLRVSDNRRFLVREDGEPFFWLGDTAWELFHRLNREQAELYLKDRASKGYTVIQAVVLAELDGQKISTPYKAWWFDPRTGKATPAGTYAGTGEHVFTPPTPGEQSDWVLVLDDVAKKYPAPGTRNTAKKKAP